jgi:hypothetical protein
MLGPGLGEVIARMITDTGTEKDNVIRESFFLYRDPGGEMEALK